MDTTNKLSEFITEDVAYFLGMTVGKGTLIHGNENTKLMIQFPFKNLEAEGITQSYDTHLYLSNSVDRILSRLRRLGFDIEKNVDEESRSVSLIINWHEYDISSQLLHFLLNGEHSDYHSFRIPKAIFEADTEKQKEFLRGYFDVTGHIRKSNADRGGQHRIYLEVDQRNWLLNVDLYELIEKHLGIPIQTINFGHPNFRGATGWGKEHQIKIYANRFLPIGSYLSHKNDVLRELAAQNRSGVGINRRGPMIGTKPSIPEENSNRLPDYIRNKHFNHYTELLQCLIEYKISHE